ncbi:hypothetical protein ACFC8N_47045 [Streptomyces sp. NPDC055966]|uniref:hypothetical protein n=1 Tax=Streptomyces sp. NPDC055966 TaxID=3345669 RepID=UPI0035E0812B
MAVLVRLALAGGARADQVAEADEGGRVWFTGGTGVVVVWFLFWAVNISHLD